MIQGNIVFWRAGQHLFMQITKMNHKISLESNTFHSSNGLAVGISSVPELENDIIYLFGDGDKRSIVFKKFRTLKALDIYFDKCIVALEEFDIWATEKFGVPEMWDSIPNNEVIHNFKRYQV